MNVFFSLKGSNFFILIYERGLFIMNLFFGCGYLKIRWL